MNIYKKFKLIKIDYLDLIICFCFILILSFFMYLPENIINILKINVSSSSFTSILSFIFSSYVHNNTFHFLGNISIFLLILIPFLIILNNFNRSKKLIIYILFFIILPLLNSLVHLIFSFFTNINPSCGSSAIIVSIVVFTSISYIIIFIKYLVSIRKSNKKIGLISKSTLYYYIFVLLVFLFYYSYMMIYTNSKLNLGHLIGIIFGVLSICICYIIKNIFQKSIKVIFK